MRIADGALTSGSAPRSLYVIFIVKQTKRRSRQTSLLKMRRDVIHCTKKLDILVVLLNIFIIL